MSIASRSGIVAAGIVLAAMASARPAHAGKIYWPERSLPHPSIQRAELDGTNVETVVPGSSGALTGALAVDSVNRKIYWGYYSSSGQTHTIRRANLDGTGTEIMFDLFGLIPDYIALDPYRGKYYVSLAGFEFCGGLWRIDMHVHGGLGYGGGEMISEECIFGVAVDSAAAKLYWTERDSEFSIRRANLDGTAVETVLELDFPAGAIDVDPARGKIYWSNWWGADHVLRADLDGSNPEVLVSEEANGAIGIALDLLSDKLYWAYDDGTVRQIRRADLDGSNPETILDTRVAGQIDVDPVPNGADVPAVSVVGCVVLLLLMLGVSAVVLRKRVS